MRIKSKIVRVPKIGAPRFTRTEMREIGDAVKDEEIARIRSARKVDGNPAAPLKVKHRKSGAPYGYAIEKQKKKGRNKRDWKWSGDMLESLKTTVSDPTRAVIKFSAAQIKKAAIRDAKDQMFGLSGRGEKSGVSVAAKYLDKAIQRATK